jgi:hypothetical protein
MDIRDIADALTPENGSPPLTLRKGKVNTGGTTTSATVFVGGSTTAVTVYFPKNAPANGAACYLLQQGPLLVGIG